MNRTEPEIQQGLQAFYNSQTTGRFSPHVSEVTLLGSGFEADVFTFSLEAVGTDAGEGQNLVLRLYASEETSDKATREFAVMRQLQEAGYPVPRVLALNPTLTPFGRPFIIMERIQGASLGQSYWAGSEEKRRESQATLYKLIANLHMLHGDDIFPDLSLKDARNPYNFIDHEIARLHTLLGRLEGREPPSLRKALAWLSSRQSEVLCERLVVVHGDFHYNNVLLHSDGAPCVIDWSNAHLADCRSELAWTRLITYWILPENVRSDEIEAGLRLYERLTGKEIMGLTYFEVIACIHLLLSELISLHFGAAHQGMRPEAEARMRQESSNITNIARLLQERTGIDMPDLEDTLSSLLN